MIGKRLRLGGWTLSTLMIVACTPNQMPLLVPATVAAPVPPAVTDPAAPPPVAVTAPTPVEVPSVPVAAVAPLQVTVVYPAATFQKVRNSMRTQSLVPPEDLTLDDLRRLSLQFAGTDLRADEFSVTGIEYDSQTNLVVTLRLTGITGSGLLRVATPKDGVVLFAYVGPGGGGGLTVDAVTTTNALLEQTLRDRPPIGDADRQAFQAMVQRQVQAVLTASRSGNVATDPHLLGLLQRIGSAVSGKVTLDADTLTKIETPPSLGGGGGTAVAPPYTIDQLVKNGVTGTIGTPAWNVGQTFRVPTTGKLTKIDIDVQLRYPGPKPSDTQIEVYDTVGGLPNGPAMGTSATVTAVDGINSFTFAAGPTLTGGRTYAMVVKCTGLNEVNLGVNTANPYADGNLFWGDPGALPYTAVAANDIRFQLFITP